MPRDPRAHEPRADDAEAATGRGTAEPAGMPSSFLSAVVAKKICISFRDTSATASSPNARCSSGESGGDPAPPGRSAPPRAPAAAPGSGRRSLARTLLSGRRGRPCAGRAALRSRSSPCSAARGRRRGTPSLREAIGGGRRAIARRMLGGTSSSTSPSRSAFARALAPAGEDHVERRAERRSAAAAAGSRPRPE